MFGLLYLQQAKAKKLKKKKNYSHRSRSIYENAFYVNHMKLPCVFLYVYFCLKLSSFEIAVLWTVFSLFFHLFRVFFFSILFVTHSFTVFARYVYSFVEKSYIWFCVCVSYYAHIKMLLARQNMNELYDFIWDKHKCMYDKRISMNMEKYSVFVYWMMNTYKQKSIVFVSASSFFPIKKSTQIIWQY